VNLLVTVEAKDEYGDDCVPGHLPANGDVAFALADRVADETKHDSRLGWRVISMDEVQ
jgi:hypothetical protein